MLSIKQIIFMKQSLDANAYQNKETKSNADFNEIG
jgi:hypothetical protein